MTAENSNQNNQQSKADSSTPESHPLRVDFISSDQFPVLQKLGILSVSGEINWERDLEQGLDYLEEFHQVSWLVLLNKNGDLTGNQVDDFSRECFLRGINSINCSLKYSSVPLSLKEVAGCIGEIVGCLIDKGSYDDEYKNVVIYSTGDLAISGVMGACAIVAAGAGEISPAESVRMIRAVRSNAIETGEQERFVSVFSEYWKIYIKGSRDFYRQKGAVTEEVLSFGWFGDGVGIYRYKTPAGKWNFYNASLSISPGAKAADATFTYDPDKIPFWEIELFDSVTEVLNSLGFNGEIPFAHAAFIHPEYRTEIKEYVEGVYANLTGEQRERLQQPGGHLAKTPEEWLAQADEFTRHGANFDNDQNKGRENSAEFTIDPPMHPLNLDEAPKVAISSRAKQVTEHKKIIKARVGSSFFEAKSVPEIYKQVLIYLTDNGLLNNIAVPIITSETRYWLSRNPIHPSGKNFFSPVEYGGFYLEAHNNRPVAIKHLKTFVESLQIEFEIVEENAPVADVEPSTRISIAQTTIEQRFFGSLLGLAAGDALGTTVEFKPTGTFPRVTTITGGGPFELNAGEWTDDTSMALCLAESLIESNGFDAFDQMRRYCRWKNDGYLSSNGTTFDIGMTIRRALEKFESEQASDQLTPFCGSVSPTAAGNGSLMRLAPVPLFFANDAKNAINRAADSSRTTHGAHECIDACRYMAALIIGALWGRSKEELLSAKFTPLAGLWEVEPLAPKVAEIAEGSFKASNLPQITGSIQGYVIPSLHAALWAFYHTDNFVDGALKVVNLGYDADTYGAIYGQLAGAYYGVQSIPNEWLNLIAKRDLIESLARGLHEASAH